MSCAPARVAPTSWCTVWLPGSPRVSRYSSMGTARDSSPHQVCDKSHIFTRRSSFAFFSSVCYMKNSLQIHASPRGCQPVTRHPHRSPAPGRFLTHPTASAAPMGGCWHLTRRFIGALDLCQTGISFRSHLIPDGAYSYANTALTPYSESMYSHSGLTT